MCSNARPSTDFHRLKVLQTRKRRSTTLPIQHFWVFLETVRSWRVSERLLKFLISLSFHVFYRHLDLFLNLCSLWFTFYLLSFYKFLHIFYIFTISTVYFVCSVSGGLSPAAAVSSLDSALTSGDETVILGALNAVSSLSLVARNEEQREDVL